MDNYYRILGIDPTASADEIKSRYRILAKAFHPDRFSDPELKAQAESHMKRVNEAYTVLSNPEKRRKYDHERGLRQSSGTATQPARSNVHLSQYLLEVKQRWQHLLEPFPQSEKQAETLQLLFQLLFALLDKIYSKPGYEQIRSTVKDIEDRLIALMITNICLGIEYEKNGQPLFIEPIDLQIASTLPLQVKFNQLIAKGYKRKRLIEIDLDEIGEALTKQLFTLCEQGQALGVAIAKNGAAQAASPAGTPAAENALPNWKICHTCGQVRPTAEVAFRQNIGVFTSRYYRKVEGNLCAECIEKNFWEMTGITLLFGWWGFIACIASPYILATNTGSYLRALKVRKSSKNLVDIALLWKFSILATIIFITYLVIIGVR